MFDTVALSETTYRKPSESLAAQEGVHALRDRTGALYKIIVNGVRYSHEPRITLTRIGQVKWIIRAEVSIPAWIFGSNLYLPGPDDVPKYLERMNDHVGQKTGMRFDAKNSRVARLDVTQDYRVPESRVIPIIDKYRLLKLSKCNTISINRTTITFDNRGRESSRRILLYSKFHERQDRNAQPSEIEMARGLLRLEIQYPVNKSVNRLAKSLGLPDHTAKSMLTESVAQTILARTRSMLSLQTALTESVPNIDRLFECYGRTIAYRLITHLWLQARYGPGYFNNSTYGISAKTAAVYTQRCLAAGIFGLE